MLAAPTRKTCLYRLKRANSQKIPPQMARINTPKTMMIRIKTLKTMTFPLMHTVEMVLPRNTKISKMIEPIRHRDQQCHSNLL